MIDTYTYDRNHVELPRFNFAVGMGLVSNAKSETKFGTNTDVGSTYETLWTQGGVYSWLAAATVLKISSGSVDDATGNGGATSVRVYGLDADYLEINEDVILNGRTAVNTTLEYLRVHRMEVLTAEADNDPPSNTGIIYAGTGNLTAGVPDNVYTAIAVMEGQTLQCFDTIPAGVGGHIATIRYFSSIAKVVVAKLMVRELGGAFRVKDYVTFREGTIQSNFEFPISIPAKSDIQMMGKAGGGGGNLSGTFEILLLDE